MPPTATTRQVSTGPSRLSVGLLAFGCLLSGLLLWGLGPSGEPWVFWRAALVRVGIVMVAIWAAMPSRHRLAAWANVSWTTLGGLVLAMLLLTRARLPLRILVPGLIVAAILVSMLRPRSKPRPARRT